jgi:hypothetical protein
MSEENDDFKDSQDDPQDSELNGTAADEIESTSASESMTSATDQAIEVTDTEDDESTATTRRLQILGKTLRENLSNGFKALKMANSGNAAEVDALIKRAPHSHVAINFIDPTTAGTTSSAKSPNQSQKFSFMSPLGGKGSAGDAPLTLNLYEKLVTILQRDYQNTLRSVPFEHLRTGAPGNIEKLPVRTILTHSHGTSHAASGDANVPWGGGAAVAAPVSDPAEWHNGPFCHVYIAACESSEHYRTKVRPSLQAFVSQIEGAAAASSRAVGIGAASSSNYSAHYVIVYVPIRKNGSGENDERSVSPKGGAGDGLIDKGQQLRGAIASRVAAARRSVTTGVMREMSSDSHHSSRSDDATESEDFPIAPFAPIANKTEKEVFKKFCSDFPNGRTCILSTLMDPIEEDPSQLPSAQKNQEWSGFLRMLGSAIVSGFRDRCRRYDEELRRLDAARAADNNTIQKTKVTRSDSSRFDLGHFFLVKESLAFTFEQMQLPDEALLQYEELRAFLPETSGEDDNVGESEEERKKRKKRAARRQSMDFNQDATILAILGDTIGFRKRLRSVSDIGIVEQTVLQYMFARETSLLFQLGDPVQLLRRSYLFVQSMYKMKVKGLGIIEETKPTAAEIEQRKLEAEVWALNFCWDVKCASDNYFTVLQLNDEQKAMEFSFSKLDRYEEFYLDEDHDKADDETGPVDPEIEDTEIRMASLVGELLEFARVRFLRIGDVRLSSRNPIRKIEDALPVDLMEPWTPWVAEVGAPNVAMDESEHESPSRRILAESEDIDLLEGAFDSGAAFEDRYLQIAGAVVRCNRRAGRRRFASRIQTQIAEIYMRRGDYRASIRTLLPMVDVCAIDGWDRCHFWHLFRLASCQRTKGKVPAYLNTLTLCFGPHLSTVAPKAAAEALQRDFEAVVSYPQVEKLRLGSSSFLETDLMVGPTSGGKSSMLLNFARKKLVKSFCKVGETITAQLTMRSHLPNPITVDAVNLLLIALGRFEEIYQNRQQITKNDAFVTLQSGEKPTIEPGDNVYEFTWTPMSTGVFMLATVQINWEHGRFHYDSISLRKPLSAIEVLASNPTQSIELNPLFLIPGHEQLVRLSFNSGTDIIREGTVELMCSDGLQVVPPGTEPDDEKWVESCLVELPACKQDGNTVLTTWVKSTMSQSIQERFGLNEDRVMSNSVQTMQARVMTSYYHKGYKDSVVNNENFTPCMRTTLEATVTTLDKPAFTVDECRTYSYSEGSLIICILLHCNTPVPFSIKEWDVELPRLQVTEDGDMNQDLFGNAISEGEQLSLTFKCSYVKGQEDSLQHDAEPVLRIVLQDEFGKTFNQVLPLDLFLFYDQLRRDEEYSGNNSVDAELTFSEAEGLVGGPVSFSVSIDANNVAKLKTGNDIMLLYKIISDDTDWIIGGQVQGLLDCSKTKTSKIDFVGIPVRPGVVKQFPSLLVQYEASPDDSMPMTVHMRHPDYYKCHPFVNHMALACPAGLDA